MGPTWVERERDMWRNSYGIAAVHLEQARERAEKAERDRDEWKARAGAAEARLADPYSQVSQDAAAWDRVAAHPALRMDLLPDVEGSYADCVFERITWLAEVAEAVTEMKPAVAAEARTTPAVTREYVDACVYGSRRAGRECDEQGFVPVHVQEAVDQLCDLFGVEAGQATDPVEERAREIETKVRNVLTGVMTPLLQITDSPAGVYLDDLIPDGWDREFYRDMARRALGQEGRR